MTAAPAELKGPTPEQPQPQSEQMNSESHQSDHEA